MISHPSRLYSSKLRIGLTSLASLMFKGNGSFAFQQKASISHFTTSNYAEIKRKTSSTSSSSSNIPFHSSIEKDQRERIDAILNFWYTPDWDRVTFRPQMMQLWFAPTEEVDEQVKENFLGDYNHWTLGKYSKWNHDRDGALALVILLDQPSRQLFRKQAQAFAADGQALSITLNVLENRNWYNDYTPFEKAFFLTVLEHQENSEYTRKCVDEFELMMKEMEQNTPELWGGATKEGITSMKDYAVLHDNIIQKFGRYPHRNAVLDRESTPAEIEYLKDASTFGQ